MTFRGEARDDEGRDDEGVDVGVQVGFEHHAVPVLHPGQVVLEHRAVLLREPGELGQSGRDATRCRP